MAKVWGFDEAGFNRVRQAVRRTLGTPRSGARQRRQAPVLGGGRCTSLICRPRSDVDTGEAMICDVQEGPILLETDTGETIIAINTGSLIAGGTRCEAIHYSCRKGGEPHLLTSDEVSSFLSSDKLSDGVSSTSGDQYAEYELFSLEC